ncbi:MAG: hypothetical protein QOF82_2144 [Frankiales bacterium]|nr:hypothetical protein [Frankiales bacterium]MDX6213057.1 hypothetical protein [Frankiales bacterium]MDX6223476.1 hypothetical protein [Frankiales bacterium]
MRIYLPATLPLLAKAKAELALTDGPTVGFAVTPALREWYVGGDLEELEYAAMTAAARASLALLAADPSALRRRVVLAADVPDAMVRALPDGPREQLSILAPLPWSALASVHVDGFEAEPAVAAAADAVQAAAAGDEDAQFVVDGAEDESLLWYAAQEADDLLAGAEGTLGDEGAGS